MHIYKFILALLSCWILAAAPTAAQTGPTFNGATPKLPDIIPQHAWTGKNAQKDTTLLEAGVIQDVYIAGG